MTETKNGVATAETRAAMHEMLAAFEAFKAANDHRLAEIESRRSDPLLEEKVARIDAGLQAAQARIERAAAEARRPSLGGTVVPVTPPDPQVQERKSAWAGYMKAGATAGLQLESKGLAETAPSTGGYIAPPETERLVERRLMASSPMREIASVRTVGAALFRKPYSVAGVDSGWVAETAARPETAAPTLALLEFPAAELYACPAATQSLLDDAFVNLDEWLANEVQDAFAAQETAAFVNGDGVNKPKGFLAYPTVADGSQVWGQIGYVVSGAAGAFAASSPADKLMDLAYLPSAPYRPAARFVMNRRTTAAIRKFKDASGAYIWSPGLQPGQAPTLLGYPVTEIETMPDIAANSFAVAFGDFRKGYAVTLYPFVMMDVPPGNGLPDPQGASEQAAYPWRGRISCHPAPGQPGSVDKSAVAAAQVSAFFGAATASQASIGDGQVAWSEGVDWGFRRFVLHCAKLAQLAGEVDGFLIGSELVGLSTVRSSPTDYPAVQALRTLAADVRGVLGAAVKIGYAADWTEYFGHQPADGSGDACFHLDPLWADANIDFVGVDLYPPITDWRSGDGGLDAAAGFEGPYDPVYLSARVRGGEAFDWFYATEADRATQTRTPIIDGAYGEPWVFRPKDLWGWWSNVHHDRPGGVRSAAATGWTPGMKPIRLTEFGCPAVDKGANSPNLFFDPKSAESALPPFSTGARDDLGQRRALEAVLAHFDDPGNNPISEVYGRPMVEAASAWCWDARPFPDFPARERVWADAPNWSRGHWLNGRCGQAPVADLLAALLTRGGVDASSCDLSGAEGLAAGFVVDRPMALSDAIRPLMQAFAFDLAEAGGRLTAVARDHGPALTFGPEALALGDEGAASKADRTLEPTPDLIRVRYIDGAADYQTGQALARATTVTSAGAAGLDLPLVLEEAEAGGAGARLLARVEAERDQATVYVGPLMALSVEPGDVLVQEGDARRWRVARVEADERPRLSLTRAESVSQLSASTTPWRVPDPHRPAGPPALLLLDLPLLEGFEAETTPIVAGSADPWRGLDIAAGPSASALTLRARVDEPAVIGHTLTELASGPLHRLDRASSLVVAIEGGSLSSCTDAELLNGANTCAVRGAGDQWEVLQFGTAELVGAGVYRLSRMLRGQAGSDAAMTGPVPAGSPLVLLTPDLPRARLGAAERGLPLVWRAAPAGAAPFGLASVQALFVWEGVSHRPLSPAHLKASPHENGDIALSWIRRTRMNGDSWDGEVPLGEESETYRVEVIAGRDSVRATEVSVPDATYTAAQQAADFPGGLVHPITIRVRQRSAIYGWGAAAARHIC